MSDSILDEFDHERYETARTTAQARRNERLRWAMRGSGAPFRKNTIGQKVGAWKASQLRRKNPEAAE